jgi:hypothetical protein
LAAKVVQHLSYIQDTYTGSASYLKFQERPMIFLYGMEAYHLDWEQIRTALVGNPILVFRPANSERKSSNGASHD